jgi:acetylornithine deacetylase/succinyl-diaminopimelate desuccinylase-like protein
MSNRASEILLGSLLITAVVASLAPAKAETRSQHALALSAAPSAGQSDQAVELLSKYLQVNTTNPPGNEKLGAEFLASVLKENGLMPQIFETGNNRAGVYCRLKGNGSKKALVLLNHIDVVPAKADDWREPPFAGKIKDGEIWGRGAIDMKSMGIAELCALIDLKKRGVNLDRDVIFLATPDEEVGGLEGARWFAKNHPELFKDAEFLFNEGFSIDTAASGKPLYWGVDISEKSVLWLKVKTKGEAGHASMPMSESAPNRLVRALDKLAASPPPPTVLPAVAKYFSAIASRYDEPVAGLYRHIDHTLATPAEYSELLKDRLKSSMVRNTVSLTVLKAGYKTNVIPAEAEAELDCRLLPGVKPESFIAELKKIIDDPQVEISTIDWEGTDASSYDTAAFQAVEAVANKENPDVPVVPMVVPWFTDAHWFRDLGIICYGFAPFKVDPEHLATMHGKDERIGLDNLKTGVRLLGQIVERLCAHH